MKGKCINQIDNIVTFETEGNYQFSQNEKVNIETEKRTFLDELRGLYWILLGRIIDNEFQYQLPDAGKWFKKTDLPQLAKEKLYIYTRFIVGWVELKYDKNGSEIIIARSTGNRKISQEQFSKLYSDTFEWLSKYIDTEPFLVQYEKEREIRGKFY